MFASFEADTTLARYVPVLVDEELTPELLLSMRPDHFLAAMEELGVPAERAKLMLSALGDSSSATNGSVAPSPTPGPVRVDRSLLISPPRYWPDSAPRATAYVQQQLGGTRMRLVGAAPAEDAALAAGVYLVPDDAAGNAKRLRERTGWEIVCGYILFERPPSPPPPSSSSSSSSSATDVADGGPAAAPDYVGVPHYWNASPRGLWLDLTPRDEAHAQAVLVESAKVAALPPPYASPAALPLIVWAVEGLCNRLRVVASYRQHAHANGRPLVVVWKRDEFCNGHFLDHFRPLHGVRFVKESPSGGGVLSGDERSSQCHPTIKNTPAEAEGYAVLSPTDAVAAAVAQRVKALFYGRPYAAMHVRRTDHLTAISQADQTSDEAFDAFVTDSELPVYLATDSADTQARLAERHAGRVRVGRTIAPKPGSLRQTSLKEAVLDLLVCAAAHSFAGSHGSSYSDAIAHLRAAHGRAGAGDRHTIMR